MGLCKVLHGSAKYPMAQLDPVSLNYFVVCTVVFGAERKVYRWRFRMW